MNQLFLFIIDSCHSRFQASNPFRSARTHLSLDSNEPIENVQMALPVSHQARARPLKLVTVILSWQNVWSVEMRGCQRLNSQTPELRILDSQKQATPSIRFLIRRQFRSGSIIYCDNLLRRAAAPGQRLTQEMLKKCQKTGYDILSFVCAGNVVN